MRTLLTRSFQHNQMKKASQAFSGGLNTLTLAMQTALQGTTFPPSLCDIGKTFVDLQEARHMADYDLSQTFIRQDVLSIIARAETVLSDWPKVSKTPAARLFLISLLMYDNLKGR